MEPVFVSADGSVIATKTKIYLPGQTIECTECCGVFLDYTHYVDRISYDQFVIKEMLTGTIVDATIKGLYNFYEFSEDTSVCVLSKYYKYNTDDLTCGPAIVVDFADPVYKFEPSDVVLIQHLDEIVFQSSTENAVYGYAGSIPYGARYRGVCSCLCYASDFSYTERRHYIYCTPPGGITVHLPGGSVQCVLCNQCKAGGYNNPIRMTDEQIRLNKTVIPQYTDASARRDNEDYDGVRLNKYIYHHVAKILRRREPGLTPLDVQVVSDVTTKRVKV
jgi:hypothetical protein